MFTQSDMLLLEELKHNPNYQIIRMCTELVQYRSRSTGHVFLITRVDFNCRFPYLMYHSHRLTDTLHHHYQTPSLKAALDSFNQHEDYVNRVEPMLVKLKRERYKYS